MNEFLLALRKLLGSLRCWIVVSPGEVALRVRLGRQVKQLRPGFHWKLPVFDAIYLQNIRARISPMSKQTVTTLSGQVAIMVGFLSYRIDDIQRLYDSIHHAEDTITAVTRGLVAEYASTHEFEECYPGKIEASINCRLNGFSRYGLVDVRLCITEFAVARTYRFIGDQNEGAWGKRLSTDTACISSGDQT